MMKNKLWLNGMLMNLGDKGAFEFDKDHEWFKVNKDKEVPEIMIYDIIGDAWDGITSKEFAKELMQIDSDEVVIRINSPGGLVYEGLAIYNALRQFPGTVTTRVDAVAASIASVIFMAGDVREMPESSDIMIHKPWSYVSGDAENMRNEADELDRVQNMLEEIYEKGTGMDREEITNMVNSTTWSSGPEALEMGFATNLLEDAKIAACMFDLNLLPGVPERHLKMASATRKREEEKALREEGLPKRDAKAKVSTVSRDDETQAEVAREEFLEMLNQIGG